MQTRLHIEDILALKFMSTLLFTAPKKQHSEFIPITTLVKATAGLKSLEGLQKV